MPNVPLPLGFVGLDDLPKQREQLVNLVNLGGSLLRTPGIDTLITAAGDGCRGAATWAADGKAYFVIGNTLYRLEDDETRTNLGTVSGSRDCVLSGGQTQLVIMVIGGDCYTYSTASGLSRISDPDFLPSRSVDFIDGRHVFIPSDGSPAFYSEVDSAGDIRPLSFFDAEELPDINRFVINVRNLLYIMGTDSTEVFNTTGDVDTVFSRRSGSRVDVGYVAGGIRYKNTFAFIGRQRDQSYGVYVMGGGDAMPIHNPAIAEDLSDYTDEQVFACRVNRFTWYGVEFLAFSIAQRTYVFCEGNWLFMDSDLNGSAAGPWRVNGVAFANGKYYVGDTQTSNIGILSDLPTEYGTDIEYQLDTFARDQRGAFIRPRMLEVDVLTGQGDTTLGLALSRDGRVWSDYHYRDLGRVGEYQLRVRWRPSGGLGRFENFMGISMRGTGPVKFSMETLNVN